MTGPVDSVCLAAAQRELRIAETKGPDLVADKRLDQAQLDLDIAAWRLLVVLFERGRVEYEERLHDGRPLGRADLERVVRDAWTRRSEAIDANQDPDRHPALLARADGVAAILQSLRKVREVELA